MTCYSILKDKINQKSESYRMELNPAVSSYCMSLNILSIKVDLPANKQLL